MQNVETMKWPLGQVIYLKKNSLVYCPIGKSGCSSYKRLMVRLSDVPLKNWILRGDVHQRLDHFNTTLQLREFGETGLRDVVGGPNLHRFSIVRDPFERLLSGYWEKLVVNRNRPRNLDHTRPIYAYVYGEDFTDADVIKGVTFAELLDCLAKTPQDKHDAHFIQQCAYLHTIPYDKVYALSEPDELMDDLTRILGFTPEVETANTSRRGRAETDVEGAGQLRAEDFDQMDVLPSKRSFLDDTTRDLLGEVTKDDQHLYDAPTPRDRALRLRSLMEPAPAT